MSTTTAVRQTRRSDIINLTVTEIMLLMVFVSLVFSFLAREEQMKPVEAYIQENAELRSALEAMKAEVVQLKNKVAQLEAEIREKDETINRLLGRDKSSISIEVVPTADMQKFRADLEAAKARIDQLERIIKTLQGDLVSAGKRIENLGGGTGYQRCAVTSNFLLDITPLADGGYSITPAWDASAMTSALAVEGVKNLVDGGHLTSAQFQQFASEVLGWSRRQTPECRFYVRSKTVETTNVQVLLEQQKLIQRYFYWKAPE